MSRIVFYILLLLNLLAIAGLFGLLGDSAPIGEPERLTNQLKPDEIRLLSADELAAALRPPEPPPPAPEPPPPPVRAPAAVVAAAPEPEPAPPPEPEVISEPVPQACLRFLRLSGDQANTLGVLAAKMPAELSLSDRIELEPTSWWVHIPPLPNRRAAERKVAEIRRLGVKDLFILQEPGPFQYSVSLGLFKNPASADLHLSRLRTKGVRTGIVTTRGRDVHFIEIRGPADALSTLASDAAERLEDVEREACEP